MAPPQGSQPSNRGVEQCGTARGGEQLAAEADHPAAGDAVLEAGTPVAGVRHLAHAAAALAEPLGDHADERVGHVDDHELHRLGEHALDVLREDLGVAQLELVALAAHRLDEDRELQLAATEHDEGVRRLGLLDADGEILLRLAHQAIAQVAAREVLTGLALAGEGRRVDARAHLDGGLLDVDAAQGARLPAKGEVDDGVAHVDVVGAGDGDDLARPRALGHGAAQALEGREHLDGGLGRTAILDDADGLIRRHCARDDAPDGEATHVVVVIDVADEDLQRRVGIARRHGHLLEDQIEQRREVLRLVLELALGDAFTADGVDEREVELRVGGVEIAEQIEDLFVNLFRACVGAVDLVDDDDDREAELEALAEHEARLGQGPLRRVDQQKRRVGHQECALDLTPEVGVARRVDHVDLADGTVLALPADAGVLGEDGDAALALEIVRVHDAVGEDLVDPERAGLAQHVVDERGLAVVDVCHDGNVAETVEAGGAHRGALT